MIGMDVSEQNRAKAAAVCRNSYRKAFKKYPRKRPNFAFSRQIASAKMLSALALFYSGTFTIRVTLHIKTND